jgi:hypothetical protein
MKKEYPGGAEAGTRVVIALPFAQWGRAGGPQPPDVCSFQKRKAYSSVCLDGIEIEKEKEKGEKYRRKKNNKRKWGTKGERGRKRGREEERVQERVEGRGKRERKRTGRKQSKLKRTGQFN